MTREEQQCSRSWEGGGGSTCDVTMKVITSLPITNIVRIACCGDIGTVRSFFPSKERYQRWKAWHKLRLPISRFGTNSCNVFRFHYETHYALLLENNNTYRHSSFTELTACNNTFRLELEILLVLQLIKWFVKQLF